MDSFFPKGKQSSQNFVKDSGMNSRYPAMSLFSFDSQTGKELNPGHQYGHFNLQPSYHQPPPKMVWNATKNIYENIPIMQHSASFPLLPCPSMFQETYRPAETLQKYPLFQPQQQQPNLERLWNVAFDFAENLVQMFCDQTKISAETLAKSKLNPNAKEFTPMMQETNNCIEPDRALEKTREDCSPKREVSPIIGIPRISGMQTKECILSPVPSLTSVMNRKATPGRKNSQQNSFAEDEMLNVSVSSGASSFGETGSLDSSYGTRTKGISESSDDFHINFEEGHDSSCDKVTTLDGQSIHNLVYEDSDLSSDEEDDDDDWDEGDYDSAGGSGFCVELDEVELAAFSCPLLQSNLVSATSVEGHPSSNKPSSSLLDDVNRRWMDQFQSTSFICLECHPRAVLILTPVVKASTEQMERAARTVSWKPERDWEVILEPEELGGDLKEARVSDYERRNAYKERLEKNIAPILQPKHRAKVFERLYGGKMD